MLNGLSISTGSGTWLWNFYTFLAGKFIVLEGLLSPLSLDLWWCLSSVLNAFLGTLSVTCDRAVDLLIADFLAVIWQPIHLPAYFFNCNTPKNKVNCCTWVLDLLAKFCFIKWWTFFLCTEVLKLECVILVGRINPNCLKAILGFHVTLTEYVTSLMTHIWNF